MANMITCALLDDDIPVLSATHLVRERVGTRASNVFKPEVTGDPSFLRRAVRFFSGTTEMGAFLFLVLALVIGAGVAYKMGYLDPYLEQIKQANAGNH
ncbi:unnamed protein product [Toxocara canis]|uniref:Essential MCU regulator, mitochondrial n=1 Tax=Toxocara canis TaxID=6265 RepID=A0A183UTN0_TOXCA|nr:unnamed protein product [Toxocara canis]